MLTAVERASELRPGLWRWDAFHPAYEQDVTSVLVEADDDVVLVDPLAPRNGEGAPFWRALDAAAEAGKRLTVVVSVPDHARSMPAIAARYPGATVHAALPARQRSLAGVPVELLADGATLPAGVVACATGRADERAIWIAPHRTLVVGDVMIGTDEGGLAICPGDWLPAGVTRATVAAAFAPLLELELHHVVPAHGDAPDDPQAAFAAAVAEAGAPTAPDAS